MKDLVTVLEFFNANANEISGMHITIATIVTIVIYFTLFAIRRYVQKSGEHFNIWDFLIKVGIAFIVEFGLIWLYGNKIFVVAIVGGILAALYVRNKLFSFIDNNSSADRDLKMRMELAELKNKFKKNPYYSILEVLLYYGYISTIQKETVEAENIFKTPDEMAREFLDKPILTEQQLDEAIGIMNVIRRENKILTREEALLLIMNMGTNFRNRNNSSENNDHEDSHSENTEQSQEDADD